jgi:small conductance mechanosensitive channel
MAGSAASPDFLSGLLDQSLMWLSVYGLRLVVALLILFIGNKLAKKLGDFLGRILEKRSIDPTLIPFIRGIVHYLLLAVIVIAALGQLGINVTSFLAILGAAGLAIGLALKDSLSNFASGVMLIIFRFFKVGDYVTVAGTSGTVETINIFNTELVTPDNQKIFVPNSSIMGSEIVNVTANDTRRLDLMVGISYQDDIERAKSVIKGVLDAEPRLLEEPEPVIAVSELGESSVNLVIRPWVKTSEYWPVRFDLIEKIKTTLDQEGITIPFPQMDVHMNSAT